MDLSYGHLTYLTIYLEFQTPASALKWMQPKQHASINLLLKEATGVGVSEGIVRYANCVAGDSAGGRFYNIVTNGDSRDESDK